jgi:hypothetical protein
MQAAMTYVVEPPRPKVLVGSISLNSHLLMEGMDIRLTRADASLQYSKGRSCVCILKYVEQG